MSPATANLRCLTSSGITWLTPAPHRLSESSNDFGCVCLSVCLSVCSPVRLLAHPASSRTWLMVLLLFRFERSLSDQLSLGLSAIYCTDLHQTNKRKHIFFGHFRQGKCYSARLMISCIGNLTHELVVFKFSYLRNYAVHLMKWH